MDVEKESVVVDIPVAFLVDDELRRLVLAVILLAWEDGVGASWFDDADEPV